MVTQPPPSRPTSTPSEAADLRSRAEWTKAWQRYDAAVDELIRHVFRRTRDPRERARLIDVIALHAPARAAAMLDDAAGRVWSDRAVPTLQLVPGVHGDDA